MPPSELSLDLLVRRLRFDTLVSVFVGDGGNTNLPGAEATRLKADIEGDEFSFRRWMAMSEEI